MSDIICLTIAILLGILTGYFYCCIKHVWKPLESKMVVNLNKIHKDIKELIESKGGEQ